MPDEKLTIQEFATKIKAKYPQYKDIEDTTLTEKILAKHPQYKEKVELKKKDVSVNGISDLETGVSVQPPITKISPQGFDFGEAGTVGIPTISPPPVEPKEKLKIPPIEQATLNNIEKAQADQTLVVPAITPEQIVEAEQAIKEKNEEAFKDPFMAELRPAEEEITPELREVLKAEAEAKEFREEPSLFFGTIRAVNEGTGSFFRTLDNAVLTAQQISADIQGLELSKQTLIPFKRTGVFGDIADHIKETAEKLPETPNTVLGNVLQDLGHLEGLFLELAITPEFKIARLAQITKGLITSVPKLTTQLGVSGFVNTFGELTKHNPEQLNKYLESFEALGYGATQGTMLAMLGYGAGKAGQAVSEATKSGIAGWSAGMGVNASGFGGLTATEQLISSGDINWDDVRRSTVMGIGLAAPGLPNALFGRAFGNYAMASRKVTKVAENIKENPESLREKAADLREKAGKEDDVKKKEELLITADAIDNLTDVMVITKDVINEPQKYVDLIKNDLFLKKEEKDFYINKINKTIADNDPQIQKAKALSEDIETRKTELITLEENEVISESIKKAKAEQISTDISEKEKELSELFAEPKPVEEVKVAPELRKYTKATEEKYGYIQEEGKPKRELTKEEFEAEQAKVEEPPVELLEVREETEITPEEFERAKETKEFTTEDGKYIITKTEKGLDVFNTTTQKSVKPQAAPHKDAIDEYKESIIPSLKRGKKAELFPGMEPKEVSRKIADESENPQEIAEQYLSLVGETKVERTLEDDIAELLTEKRVTREAFANANDPKNITKAIQLNYFKAPLDEFGRRTDAARAFDTLVERLREIGEGKYDKRDEQELIESIGEFMTENPNGPKTFLAEQKRRPDIKALEDQFFKLTKFDITEDFAKKLVEEIPLDIAEINKELLSLSKKEEIPDATIRQFEARTRDAVEKFEPTVKDIESKGADAEANRDAEAAAEILKETDEFIKAERERPPPEKPPEIEEKIKKAKDLQAEGLDELVTAFGGKAAISAEKRPDAIRAIQKIVKGLADELGLRGEALYKKVKDFIKEQIGPKFLDENREEIMGEFEKEVKPEEKIPEEEVKEAKEFVKEFDKQTEEKIQTPLKTLITKVFKKNYLTEKFFDDKVFAKRQLEKAGATEAIWKKNLTSGSGAESKARVEEMTKETFGTPFKNKLTSEEKSNLNKIILFRRTITLDEYKDAKGEKRLKHTVLKIRGKDVALTKELAEAWINDLKKESPKQFEKLNERADKYFKNNKELLKDRLDEGTIDQETFDRLVVFDYSKRMFVERMMDFELIRDGGFYTDSEIKSLKEGSEDLLFDNAEALLIQNISSTTRLIFENRANKALGKFFEKNETDFGKTQKSIGINKETGQPKYPKAPIGWKEIKYKEEGKIKSTLVTTDFYKSWTAKDPIIKQSAARAIQWATGTKPIKFFATGINPFFAFYNFVRDPGHVYFFTDSYSIFLPKAAMQLGKDLFTVAKDAWTKKGRLREYTKEGGMMDFLTTQGVAKTTLPKTKTKAAINVAIDIASKLNYTSETIVRLSVRERGIKDLTDAFIKKNKRNPTAEEIKEIQSEATAKARSVMDYSQKGEWIRAADNFLPYLAASFQGLNVASRAFRQRPLETSARIAQGVGLVVGATLYNMQWNDEDEKNGVLGYNHVPDWLKAIGQPIMMPFTVTNKKGETVRPYIIIPIPHEFSLPKTATESVTEWAATGYFKGKPITKALKIALPFRDPRDVPIIDFLYAYELGYDRFRDKFIWKDAKIEAEAEFTLRTPEIYKDIGKATGLSPDRMKLAVGKLFTQHEGNIYSIVFATGYESVKNLLTTDKEKKEFNDMAAKAIESGITPLQRRFYRYPSKKGKERDIIEDAIIAERTKRKLEEKDKIYEFISEYRKADKVKKIEIEIEVKKFANKMERESVGAKSRILNTFNKSKKTTTIKSRFIINLIYAKASPEANAKAFFEIWKESSENERIELKRDARKAGLATDRFNKAFRKLKTK